MTRRVTCLITLLALSVVAQPAIEKEITLVLGKGELIQYKTDVNRVVIAEPKIADALVVSPTEVMVNAKGVGHTTLVVWENDTAPVKYNINVIADRAPIDNFQNELAAEMKAVVPDGGVNFNGNAELIVLTGKVADGEASKKAEALAATRTKKVINLLEVPALPDPRQILLQVKFASVDRVGLSELGFNFFSRNDNTLGSLGTQQFQAPRFSQLQFQNQEFSNSTINFADLLNLFVFRPDLNIGATIRAMQAKNLLQVLAEPNLITLEGKEAAFVAGGEFPFPILTATTTGGAISPVLTVQFKPFGVQLKFTPTITSSGTINLKVRPEVSALDYSNSVTVQGVLIPAISTRRAETEVILKDGESFAIAGLIDNRVVQTLSRVRGLGDLPIIGNLFRSRSTRKSTDELLVVVTPRFVRPLGPDEHPKLPETSEAWLPTLKEQREAKGKIKTKTKQPEFVGQRGYEEAAPSGTKKK